MEWLYINRITMAIITCIASIIIFNQLHTIAINYVYTEPTTDYNIMGSLSEKDELKAMEVTERDNIFLDRFKGQMDITVDEINVVL